MSTFVIEGGHRLAGEIEPQGAKNESLQIISACLLTPEEVHVTNIPEILDVRNLIGLLECMGVKVERRGKGDYLFKADDIDTDYITSEDFVRRCASLRGSVLVVGPLLARFGEAFFAKPGGDKIGRRKVDTHITGMMNLGASLDYDEAKRAYRLTAPEGGLHGTYMLLDEASVTGTANIIMAAALAHGTTTIYNAACEPYVQQLCRLLSAMGLKIEGIASNLLTIHGAERLHGAEHRILPDMIEVGSFIGMAALNSSEITVKNVSYDNLGIIPDSFRRLGITLERRGDDIYVPAQDVYEDRNCARRLDTEYRRRAVAGADARPAVGDARSGHAVSRLGADTSEDVREPSVLRRPSDRYGCTDNAVRSAPCCRDRS